ncbi:protoporphyrinogen oxidase [Bacillus tuaregi]|uniref:protoporphyrinogen oxidase n=1 Tax=Bacillus tuaregi TaxID=1816695 RepID=UPI0008F86837|nr:protoporphyrinogen oxidase [Bacillus tuaregi]
MSASKKQIVIIGGGITGLTAAYYLQKEVRENQLPYTVKLIEASHRLGGQMQTFKKDGYLIERGPDSFLETKEKAVRLAAEVGMQEKLVHNIPGNTFIMANDQLHTIPGGAVMGIPTEVLPFMTTRLFSIPGKLRAAADLILPRSQAVDDQSLGGFFRRRLGDEVVENLIEPLLSGIYAGDIDKMSLMTLFPHFYQVEKKYRSLIIGMKKGAPPRPKESPAERKGAFLAFETGLQSFADAITARLEPDSIKLGFRVDKVKKRQKRYEIELNGGELLTADSIVMAVPHQTVHTIFSDYEFFQEFKDVPSTSVATIALGFPKEAVQQDINGTGFLISRNSDYTITSCTWLHKKWPHTTPDGKVLLRCFVGRSGGEAIVDLSDDQIVTNVLSDLSNTITINQDPELALVSRWSHAMPQYTVGHQKRLARVTKGLQETLPGIFIAGSSYNGVGLPACIQQGEEAVNNVLDYLQESLKCD